MGNGKGKAHGAVFCSQVGQRFQDKYPHLSARGKLKQIMQRLLDAGWVTLVSRTTAGTGYKLRGASAREEDVAMLNCIRAESEHTNGKSKAHGAVFCSQKVGQRFQQKYPHLSVRGKLKQIMQRLLDAGRVTLVGRTAAGTQYKLVKKTAPAPKRKPTPAAAKVIKPTPAPKPKPEPLHVQRLILRPALVDHLALSLRNHQDAKKVGKRSHLRKLANQYVAHAVENKDRLSRREMNISFLLGVYHTPVGTKGVLQKNKDLATALRQTIGPKNAAYWRRWIKRWRAASSIVRS